MASSSSSSKLVQQARPRSWPCRVGHDVAGAEPLGFRPNLAMRLRCAPRGGRGGSPVLHAQPTCCAARMKAGMPPPRTPSAKRRAQVVDRLRRALMRAPTPAEFTTSTPSDSPVARRHHAPPSCGRRPSPSSRLNSAESHVSSVGTTPATYRLMQTCIIARGQALTNDTWPASWVQLYCSTGFCLLRLDSL